MTAVFLFGSALILTTIGGILHDIYDSQFWGDE